MTREGTVKLIDFGIATRSGTRDRCLTGKPSYMAPEMVVELRADYRSDLFSLGAVLYEMLAGERLFRGASSAEILEQVVAGPIPSARARRPDLPDGAVAILDRALQRDPAQRFPSAGSMGEACEHVLYDKGYGPTNLTLKQYLGALFPDAASPMPDAADALLAVEPTLIPIRDAATLPPDPTPVSKPRPPGLGGARGRRVFRTRGRR
jgi:serine/threonine protein kinase